jgi:opacity protein-like surface antigen
MKVRQAVGCALVAVLSTASLAGAQDFTTAIGGGAKALLFSFSGLSNLGANAYNGGIGGKYYVSDMLAIRASLQFAHASQDDPANPGVGETGTDGFAKATMFGITAGGEYHFLKGRVSPYAGAGISLSTISTDAKSAVIAPAVQVETKNATAGELGYTAATQFGIAGLVGVEFFIVKEVSLGAEYQFGLAYASRPDQQQIAGNLTETTKVGSAWGFGFSTTAITLGFYF